MDQTYMTQGADGNWYDQRERRCVWCLGTGRYGDGPCWSCDNGIVPPESTTPVLPVLPLQTMADVMQEVAV